MIQNPFLTKAVVGTITNAVMDDCCTATMRSDETAVRRLPRKTIQLMCPVADAAEQHIQVGLDAGAPDLGRSISEMMRQVLLMMCWALLVTKIIAITCSGFTVRTIAALRSQQPILSVGSAINTTLRFNLIVGVTGIYSDMPLSLTNIDHIGQVLEMLWRYDYRHECDMLLAIGDAYNYPSNRMNFLQVNWVAADGT